MIKMRYSKGHRAECQSCGATNADTCYLLDIGIGRSKAMFPVTTLCKECAEELFQKSLHMIVEYNTKVKTREELKKEHAFKTWKEQEGGCE